MRVLEYLIATPLAGAVGWTVLHSLWEGAIVSAVLGAVLLIFRSPRLRYAAACMAMLAMLGAFAVTFLRMTPDGPRAAPTLQISASPAWKVVTVIIRPGSLEPDLSAIAPWLAPFWIAGVLLFYLRYMAGFISTRKLRRSGVCCAPDRWQKQLARLSAQLRLSRPILLLESCLADAPVVFGHLRPLILLPVGLLAGLPEEQIEAILLHELAHIRRHDYLVNVLQRLIEGLLFYHPAVWWISRVICAERENCCDDVVVSIAGNPHQYASALAALEQNRRSGCEPAVAATGGSLMKRIRRLLYPTKPNGAWAPFTAAAILIITAAAALGAWRSNPQSSPAAQLQTSADKYSKWLNEDVVYIITDQERAAFQKLTTDEERNKFIEQFWERRNPTPRTPENEFKQEHYRRIAYANQHFTSSEPGWKTDRGHMYIVYGPPDEIDSHPITAQRSYGIEVWTYRHVKGLGTGGSFTFIDRTGRGDYQLAPGNAQ
jgi:GWxTD domain-containing protein